MGVFDGWLRKLDNGLVAGSEGVVGDGRSSGALKDVGFGLGGDETGEAEGGVFGVLILEVSWFVSFVDDDGAEIVERSEEGGAGADDDERCSSSENALPEKVALTVSEAGVKSYDLVCEMFLEDLNELSGEGDFGEEEHERFVVAYDFVGEVEVDVGFAGAGDAVEEAGGGRIA